MQSLKGESFVSATRITAYLNAKARGVEGSLRIHAVVYHVAEYVDVPLFDRFDQAHRRQFACVSKHIFEGAHLRLHEATHIRESSKELPLLCDHRRDDRVERALPRGQQVWMLWV